MVLNEALRDKAVSGEFYKFFYLFYGDQHKGGQPGDQHTVFCRNVEDFLRLIEQWNKQAGMLGHNRFRFELADERPVGILMNPKQIAADHIDFDENGRALRSLKIMNCPYTRVEYIQ